MLVNLQQLLDLHKREKLTKQKKIKSTKENLVGLTTQVWNRVAKHSKEDNLVRLTTQI